MKLFGFSLDDLQNDFGEKQQSTCFKSEEPKKKKRQEKRRQRDDIPESSKEKKRRNFDSKLEKPVKIVETLNTTVHTQQNKWMNSILGAISEKPTSTRKLNDKSVTSPSEDTFEFIVSESLFQTPSDDVTIPIYKSSTKHDNITELSPIKHKPLRIQKNWKKYIRFVVLLLISIYVLRTLMNVAFITQEGQKHNNLRMELQMEELKIEHQQERAEDLA